MEIEQLRQLVCVAEEGTVSAAAPLLHITQPALSRSLRRLEAELGCELFDRSPNAMAPNRCGRVAVARARAVLSAYDALVATVAEESRRSRPTRVGTCAPAPLRAVVAAMLGAAPGTAVATERRGVAEMEEAVATGGLDLAIADRPTTLPSLGCVPIMTERLWLSCPPGHRLARRARVSFADLAGEGFLVYGDLGVWGDVVRREIPGALWQAEEDALVFASLSATTPLLTFYTERAEQPPTGRTLVPIEDASAAQTFYLLWKQDGEQAQLAEQLATAVRDG